MESIFSISRITQTALSTPVVIPVPCQNPTCHRCAIVCLLAFAMMTARAAEPDWTVDVHAYQYDMTAYISLLLDYGDETVSDLSRYTIAAFSGDECRGVMEVCTAEGQQYGYLRIRSNVDSGEAITFQVYDNEDDFLLPCADSLTFCSLDVQGVPSSPYLLQAESKSYVNEQMYTTLIEQIAIVQTALDAAKDSVEAACPDVASEFKEVITAIQTAINNISQEVTEQYEATSLTYDSYIDTTDVFNDISQLMTDALQAQKVYENEDAYARLTTEIATLQDALDVVSDSIISHCTDVYSDYAETISALQADIDSLTQIVQDQYETISLTKESTISTDDIATAITQLLSDAISAQVAFTNEQTYQSLNSQLDDVQAQLDAAADSIAAYCPDVAGDFASDLADLQIVIDSLRTDLTTQYNELALNGDTNIDLSNLISAIESIIEAAITAQAEVTSIISTKQENAEESLQYYTLDGIRISAPRPGQVTIIRCIDGKTQKVVKMKGY